MIREEFHSGRGSSTSNSAMSCSVISISLGGLAIGLLSVVSFADRWLEDVVSTCINVRSFEGGVVVSSYDDRVVAGVLNTGVSVRSICFMSVCCRSEKVAGVTKKGDSNCDVPATGVCSIGSNNNAVLLGGIPVP